jgi:DNA-binding SARP family transcriptional activator
VDLRILGPLEVWHEGRQIPVRGAKQRALLAVLALHANEVVSSDRLLDDLWGANPPEAGQTALRVRVSQLRKSLGPVGDRVATRVPGYVLELEDDELDLRRFEQLVSASGGQPPESATELLREALALWRGSPLEEFAYEGFAQTAIARLEEVRLGAVELRIAADLELGRHREVVPELEGLAREFPLREGPTRQLMLALYRAGRQADALQAFRKTRARLADELGLRPTPALQELEVSILRHDPALDVSPTVVPDRSILLAGFDARFEDLVPIVEPLARRPSREVIVAQLIGSASELSRATALARARREALHARGVLARAAAFTTQDPGADLVRIASEQDVDLLVLGSSPELLESVALRHVLVAAPCDVGILVPRVASYAPGTILVPFAGAEHDWTAIELAAWLARSEGVGLRLAGAADVTGRDASRLLASASLAVQRALGVEAEPLLLELGADGLLAAAEDAALVVLGLSDRWQRDGLGPVRLALATEGRPPALIVRRGLRPGGLAPMASATRFTWSIVER